MTDDDLPLEKQVRSMRLALIERRSNTDAALKRILHEIVDVKPRMTAIEVQMGNLVSYVGRTNERIDILEQRLDKIFERLNRMEDIADTRARRREG